MIEYQKMIEYQNPVYRLDFPDPFVLYVEGQYYAYATNARGLHIQVLKSADLIHWQEAGVRGEALPELPVWAEDSKSFTWAPGVLAAGERHFVLYYTTRLAMAERQCISYAVSSSPDGPFVDFGQGPFICQLEEGGSIDPEPFDANQQLWIAYHAWREPYVGYPAGMRRLYLAQVDFEGTKPVFRRPEAGS